MIAKEKRKKKGKKQCGGRGTSHVLAILWNYLPEPHPTNCLLQQTDCSLEEVTQITCRLPNWHP